MHILLVEDDTVLLNVLRDKLTSEGFEVLGAPNGKEGLDLELKAHPDLIMVDVLMPIMDGLTMLQKLRQGDDYEKKLPVILLTNLSANSEDIIKKVAETEPAHYIVKVNFSVEEIIEKIKGLLA